jgi:hypothetical protein
MKQLLLPTFIFLVFFCACNNTATNKVAGKSTERDSATIIFTKAFTEAKVNGQVKIEDDSYLKEFAKIDYANKDSGMIYALNFEKLVASGKKLSHESTATIGYYLDTLTAEQRTTKLEELKKKFILDKDEFKDLGFYYHKHWGTDWPDRKTLYCYLNTKGTIFLVSNYNADDWIFHTNALVLVDTTKYETETVQTFSELNKTQNTSGSVWENVTYTMSGDIIEAIARNPGKKVKFRLEGRQYYSEAQLTDEDKKAFKDSYDLYYLMAKK